MSTGTPSPARAEPRRLSIRLPRPLWIGLATVTLVVAAIGLRICLPIYGRHVAIREIERTGGKIIDSRPRGPQWLRDRLGGEWSRLLDQILEVQLGSDATDSTLADLTFLPEMQRLWVLDNHRMTDAGLVHIGQMTNLLDLALSGNLTDAGLVHLNGIRGLRDLLLNKTQITDAGLMHLKALTGLRGLHLRGTSVTDAGLQQLTGMVMLDWLDLSHTEVTDAGLESLKGLPMLRGIDLTGTRVSDLGLTYLKRFPGLGQVHLDGTQVTYEGYRDLVSSRPNVSVYHWAHLNEPGRRFFLEHTQPAPH